MKKKDTIGLVILSLILSLVIGVNNAQSSTGSWNSFSYGWLEVQNINATDYFLDGTNITDRLGGDFTGLGAIADTLNTGQGAYELYAMDQDLESTDAVTFDTVDTGQGANELYDMDQNVQTTDAVTFGTVDTGQGANELYDMDQNVQTTSDVSFNSVNVTSDFYYNDANITDVLAYPIRQPDFIIFKSGSTFYGLNGATGQVDYQSTDADFVFSGIDAVDGLIFVKGGTYDLDAWNPTTKLTIQGAGEELTIFNLTDANWSIDSDDDIVFKDLQFTSVVDGNSLYIIDGSVKFERVYFNFDSHTNAEAGLFKFRGGSDDYAEFKDCRWNIGDGGGTINVFFWWTTDMDHLYVDDSVVEMVNATSYAWLFSTGSGTWVESIRLTNMEVLDWYGASTGTDSAILWRNGYQVGTLTIDGYKFRVPSTDFGGDNHQLNVNGPMAKNTIITNVVMDYRSHFYGGYNDTQLSHSTITGEGTSVHRTAFDFGVQGVYGKTGLASDLIMRNTSITVNSGYRTVSFKNLDMLGSRILLANEQDASDGPKHIFIDGVTAKCNSAIDLYKDVIEIATAQTQELTTLSVKSVYMEGYYSLIECQNTPTSPLNITLVDIHLNKTSSTLPELINSAGGRDGNVSITIRDSWLECVVPPLDNWNPILKDDRFYNVVWIDTTDGSVKRSENIYNVTISSGSSTTTTTHNLPERGPMSYMLAMPTSDLANCTYYWIPWADFSDTQFKIYVGAAGAAKNCDDDVTFIVEVKLNP